MTNFPAIELRSLYFISQMMNPICRLALYLGAATCLLAPRVLAAAVPATVSLGDLVQTYDGTPKTPSAVTDPLGLNVSWRFVEAGAVQPVVETVFSNTPTPSSLSYSSHSFSAQSTVGLGDRIHLAGTARNLSSVDVTMVTWAKAITYPLQAQANPDGWHHPIKLTVFDMNSGGVLTSLGEVTQNTLVPWRPLTLPNGADYPYNGYAFPVHFYIPTGLVLPEQPVFMVSYNTGNSGFEPIGTPGPYNELNVASGGGPTIGTDVIPNGSLWVRSSTSWVYPAVGTKPPMLVVKASQITAPGSAAPPVNAGSWQATAKVSDPNYQGEATSSFTIQPAAAQIVLGNLTQIADGLPKSASVNTIPGGLSVNLTYSGSPNLPTQLGKYAVHASIQNPNYMGTADGELWLGQNLNSWLDPWVQNGSVSASATGDHDDPDHDSIDNILEYALGLDPSSAANPGLSGAGTPSAEFANHALSLLYRKNLAATDLEFQVETTTQLGGAEIWEPAVTFDSVVANDGATQTIRATLPPDSEMTHRFVRLSVRRH